MIKTLPSCGGRIAFSLTFNPVDFADFIDDSKMQTLEEKPENMRIFRDAEGKFNLKDMTLPSAIDRERLLSIINNALANQKAEIEIPLIVVLPKLEIPDDLQTMGVREPISVGFTRFVGSPANRIHNIGSAPLNLTAF